jgi:hypothetical protein
MFRHQDQTNRARAATLLAVAALSCGLAFASAAALPALRVRASNPRLIEDVNGTPFFMAGTCPQSMVTQCNSSQVDSFFANRQAKHFNCAQVDFLSAGYCLGGNSNDPVDNAGNHLFLSGSPNLSSSNINPAYLATIDTIVASAARHGHYVFLNLPTYNFNSTICWNRSPTEYYSFGQLVGNRYKNSSNVLWEFGNDACHSACADSLGIGILQYSSALTTTNINMTDGDVYKADYDGTQPYEFRYSAAPNSNFSKNLTWLTLNGWYSYFAPSYCSAREYNRPNVTMPHFIVENQYEGENGDGAQWSQSDGTARMVRNELWAEVLWGGSGYGVYGNHNWSAVMTNLDSPGALSAQHCTEFFMARAWYDLVPDQGHVFLTAQQGTPAQRTESYSSAALTADGTLGVVYYPGNSGSQQSETVAMSKMSGTTTARWYNPWNATYTSIGTFVNSGSKTFTTPGSNGDASDWVLVLEATQGTGVSAPAVMHKSGTFPTKISGISVFDLLGRPILSRAPRSLSSDGRMLRGDALEQGVYLVVQSGRTNRYATVMNQK